MKKAVGAVACIIGAIVGKVAVRAAFSPDVKSQKFLSRVADETNKGLPMMVDSETQLVTTSAEPATFIYHYKLVSMRGGDVDGGMLEGAMGPQVRTAACGNADTRKILDAGVTMRYSYEGSDGVHVADVDVSSSHCR